MGTWPEIGYVCLKLIKFHAHCIFEKKNRKKFKRTNVLTLRNNFVEIF